MPFSRKHWIKGQLIRKERYGLPGRQVLLFAYLVWTLDVLFQSAPVEFILKRIHIAESWSTWCPPCPSLQSCFPVCQPSSMCWCLEWFLPQCRTLHFSLLNFEVLGPFLPPVEVSLDGSLALWWISHSPQFCVICLFTESVLYHIIQIINEDIKQD